MQLANTTYSASYATKTTYYEQWTLYIYRFMKTKWKDQRGLSSRENSIQKFAVAASKKNRSSWKKNWRHYTFYWQPDEGRWSGISFRNQTAITDKGRQPCHLSSGDFPTEVRWWGDRRFWWKFRYKANLVQFFLSLSVTFTSMIPREASHPRSEIIHIAREMYMNVRGPLPSTCTVFSQSLSVNSLRLDHTARNALAARNNEA